MAYAQRISPLWSNMDGLWPVLYISNTGEVVKLGGTGYTGKELVVTIRRKLEKKAVHNHVETPVRS